MISPVLNLLRRSALVALGVGVLIPFAALAQDVASAPADSKAEAARFVASYAASTGKDATARWLDPICVRVVGLADGEGAAVKARVEAVAQGVGVAVVDASRRVGGRCLNNIEIGFTSDPQAMLDGVIQRTGHALGDATSNTRTAKAVTLPVQAWYLTNGVTRARYDAPKEAWKDLKVPVLWQSAIAGADGSFGGGPGAGYGAPGGQAPAVGWGGSFMAPPFDPGPGPAHAPPPAHRGFLNVFVIVDVRRMGDKSLGLISDYVAMLALSQPRALGTCQALPSITDLFATDCGRPAPDGLTPADAAFLTALYDAKLSRTADIADGMAAILGQTRVAAR